QTRTIDGSRGREGAGDLVSGTAFATAPEAGASAGPPGVRGGRLSSRSGSVCASAGFPAGETVGPTTWTGSSGNSLSGDIISAFGLGGVRRATRGPRSPAGGVCRSVAGVPARTAT